MNFRRVEEAYWSMLRGLVAVLIVFGFILNLAAESPHRRIVMAEFKSPVIDGSEKREVTYHNGNPEHYPIPALRKEGSILMRLVFDDDEREAIFLGNDVFVEILGAGIQPIRFIVGDREVNRKTFEGEGY